MCFVDARLLCAWKAGYTMHFINRVVRSWMAGILGSSTVFWTFRTTQVNPALTLQCSYVYWTVHHLDSWIKGDQLDVTCFIISLFNAQHVLDVNISILRSLRLIFLSYFMCCIALVRCALLLRCLCRLRHSASACIRIPHHHSQTTT